MLQYVIKNRKETKFLVSFDWPGVDSWTKSLKKARKFDTFEQAVQWVHPGEHIFMVQPKVVDKVFTAE
jgi:hypothetical protein